MQKTDEHILKGAYRQKGKYIPLTKGETATASYQEMVTRHNAEQSDFILTAIQQGDVPGMSEVISAVSENLSSNSQRALNLTNAVIQASKTNEQAKSMLEMIRYMRIAALYSLEKYKEVIAGSGTFVSMYPGSDFRTAVEGLSATSKKLLDMGR